MGVEPKECRLGSKEGYRRVTEEVAISKCSDWVYTNIIRKSFTLYNQPS